MGHCVKIESCYHIVRVWVIYNIMMPNLHKKNTPQNPPHPQLIRYAGKFLGFKKDRFVANMLPE